ncbi:MAG: methionyl-tRNA formyltransferase [Akkermansiaceae bacterium]|nr:methionyl-tRNA formyltransferase [Akkermansiaceae bacterium]
MKRIVYMATGDIALPAFRHLLVNGPKPLALVTQPDKPVGRKQVLTPPRLKHDALEAGVPVLQPEVVGDCLDELKALEPELIVVMAYGQILKGEVLEIASEAIINLHASLLPKYRGAACIQAAIDAGDAETGITAQHVVRKLDAGDLIHAKRIPIAADETGASLHDRLAELAVPTLVETMELLSSGQAPRTPQVESEASYVGKLSREDGRLNWSMSAEALERRIRAYEPWPGTYTTVEEDEKSRRLKVFAPTRVADEDLGEGEVLIEGGRLRVGTGKGSLELTQVQAEGSKRMSAGDYLRAKSPSRFHGWNFC